MRLRDEAQWRYLKRMTQIYHTKKTTTKNTDKTEASKAVTLGPGATAPNTEHFRVFSALTHLIPLSKEVADELMKDFYSV